jgi:predicted permease
LSGAGLLGQSLYRLLHVPLGFEPANLATVQVTARGSDYPAGPRLDSLYREIANRAAALPGARSAASASTLPAECSCASDAIRVVGRPDLGEQDDVTERHVSPGYLHAMGATLLRGRDFADSDDATVPGVAVINQALARTLFADADPIGRRISDNEGGRLTEWQIVGVVADVHEGPLDAPDSPVEYFPLAQAPDHSFNVAVRTSQGPAAMLPTLVAALHQIDPNLGVSDEATMSARISGTQAALLHRFSAWLVGGFASLALVLGTVGLYGVIAYSVSQRTREIGVRMALGAQRGSVYRLVLRQAAGLALAGIGIGIAGAIASSLLIRKLLFGVKAWDVPTLAAVALLLAGASLAAGFLPARRAVKVNPVDALRAE